MTNQTLFFDLTNPEIVQYIKNLSIEDLMLDNTDSDSKGTYRPFNIIFKMEGLFAKKKPKYWEIFNQFRESNYPFRFVALFVDEYKDKDLKAKIILSQELEKPDISNIWIPGPTGLELDGNGVTVSIAKWDKDLNGENAINEFIEIVKIPEVFDELIEQSSGNSKVYIPGYKKLSAGFNNSRNTFDVFFKALDSIGGSLKVADSVSNINISRPSEIFLGSDLDKSNFIVEGKDVFDDIQEIKSLQDELLDAFGISNKKATKNLKSKVIRVGFTVDVYTKRLEKRFDEIKELVNKLSKEFSSFDSKKGLLKTDIKKLEDIGIDIGAEISELTEQGDSLIEKINNDIISTLKQKQTLEVVLPTLDNEIDMLKPRTSLEIEEKIKESYEVRLFNKISELEKSASTFLKIFLGKKFWTRFVNFKNLIASSLIFAIALSFFIYIDNYRSDCSELLGDENINEYSISNFYTQFVIDDTQVSKKCKTLLPTSDAYEQAVENGDQEEIQEWIARRDIINDAGALLTLFLIPLGIFPIVTFISFILVLITDYLLKQWARGLKLNELNTVSRNLESNIGDIVINDIKYGYLRGDLASKVISYKELLIDIKEFFEAKQEDYENKEIDKNEIATSTEQVNPQYSEKIISNDIQSQTFFEKFVSVCREEILEMLNTSSNANKDRLFGRKPEDFKKLSFQQFSSEIDNYINKIVEQGILDTETEQVRIQQLKQDIKKELWDTGSIKKNTIDKVTEASKTSDIMQMVDQNNIQILDTQNHQWKFLKFIPKELVSQYKVSRSSSTDDYIEVSDIDATGYIRLIPVKRSVF